MLMAVASQLNILSFFKLTNSKLEKNSCEALKPPACEKSLHSSASWILPLLCRGSFSLCACTCVWSSSPVKYMFLNCWFSLLDLRFHSCCLFGLKIFLCFSSVSGEKTLIKTTCFYHSLYHFRSHLGFLLWTTGLIKVKKSAQTQRDRIVWQVSFQHPSSILAQGIHFIFLSLTRRISSDLTLCTLGSQLNCSVTRDQRTHT